MTMTFTRRRFLATSAATTAAVAAPFISRGFAQQVSDEAYFADLHTKAKAEGEVTWYIGHWRTETAERVGTAFEKAYPGVRCNVVRATGQVLFQRLSQDNRAGVANCDVFSSTDLGQYVTLRNDKKLLAFKPRRLAECAEIARDFDPTNHITITDANTSVMCYNSKLVPEKDVPKNWTDLIDPKWKDQVAVAHPAYSGAMGGWVLTMKNLYGWDFLTKLKANNPQVGRSLVDPVTAIASGERKIGIGPGSYTANLEHKGDPMRTVYPTDGTIIGFSPTSLLTTSKRQNAGKLFLEFMLGKETAVISSGEFTTPVRTDIEPQPGIAKLGSRKGITRDPEQLAKEVPEAIERWRDLFGV